MHHTFFRIALAEKNPTIAEIGIKGHAAAAVSPATVAPTTVPVVVVAISKLLYFATVDNGTPCL